MTVLTDKELGDALDDIRAVREAQERKERFEMTPQPHDFKSASDKMPVGLDILKPRAHDWLTQHQDAIRFALRLAERVCGEPSEGMVQAGVEDWHIGGLRLLDDQVRHGFKAMMSQAIAEIGEGK